MEAKLRWNAQIMDPTMLIPKRELCTSDRPCRSCADGLDLPGARWLMTKDLTGSYLAYCDTEAVSVLEEAAGGWALAVRQVGNYGGFSRKDLFGGSVPAAAQLAEAAVAPLPSPCVPGAADCTDGVVQGTMDQFLNDRSGTQWRVKWLQFEPSDGSAGANTVASWKSLIFTLKPGTSFADLHDMTRGGCSQVSGHCEAVDYEGCFSLGGRVEVHLAQASGSEEYTHAGGTSYRCAESACPNSRLLSLSRSLAYSLTRLLVYSLTRLLALSLTRLLALSLNHSRSITLLLLLLFCFWRHGRYVYRQTPGDVDEHSGLSFLASDGSGYSHHCGQAADNLLDSSTFGNWGSAIAHFFYVWTGTWKNKVRCWRTCWADVANPGSAEGYDGAEWCAAPIPRCLSRPSVSVSFCLSVSSCSFSPSYLSIF